MKDYKKKYEDALNATRKFKNDCPSLWNIESNPFKGVFEELEEDSNGEKIRKELIHFFKNHVNSVYEEISDNNVVIDWLENQDKKDSEDESIRKELIKLMKQMSNTIVENYTTIEISTFVAWIEKQGEQKRWNELTWEDINTIEEIINEVHSDFRNGIGAKSFGEEVLERFIEIKGDEKKELKMAESVQPELPNGEDYGIDSLYHAERILEKTLGEVDGYQSDDGILEHKCAIEAVKRLYKQKPTWSEEDDARYYGVIETEQYVLDVVNGRREFSVGNEQIRKECIKELDWLKSIKERYVWKPSDEQIEMLEKVRKILHDNEDIYSKANNLIFSFEELIRTLKKLKEE